MSATSYDIFVMIIEDDDDLRESLAEVLEDEGIPSVGACNGNDALERLRSNRDKPCIILLDLMMPVMDGWQFRAAQRDDPELSGIPVAVLTAHADIHEFASAMDAVAWLQKPVQLESLRTLVRRFCQPSSAQAVKYRRDRKTTPS